MRVKAWQAAVAIAGLVTAGLGSPGARAQTADELKQRMQELEQSTREQLDTLKRMIQDQERQRTQERRTEEERERTLQILKDQVEEQRLALREQDTRMSRVDQLLNGFENFFDLQAGAKASNNDPNPLGKSIQGNVYSGDKFKIRIGGSLRLHVQRNDTPVGTSVSQALFPPRRGEAGSGPGDGNNGGRDNFRAFGDRTRLNLAIEGPETLGGKTQGFFEFDFNRRFTTNEGGAVNPNPRLRHAFGRWRFSDLLTKGDELVLTFGQTGSFADDVPDSVDFNTQLAGLGAALRRNPRVEVIHRYPLTSNIKLITSVGAERPLFASGAGDVLGTGDLGPGTLSAFPAFSGGVGLEAGRLALVDGFGIGKSSLYVRTTWGETEERFNINTAGFPFTQNTNAVTNFREQNFTQQAVHGALLLDRIGFNKTGRAMTFKFKGGGVWALGDAAHLNAEFGPRVNVDSDGDLRTAQSAGGWVNPQFFLTDTLSIRWLGATQFLLKSDRPVVAGTPSNGTISSNNAFFRTQNRQQEVSIWWTPGPFTFALAYNHTVTKFKHVNLNGIGSESRENENNKIEFISWFNF